MLSQLSLAPSLNTIRKIICFFIPQIYFISLEEPLMTFRLRNINCLVLTISSPIPHLLCYCHGCCAVDDWLTNSLVLCFSTPKYENFPHRRFVFPYSVAVFVHWIGLEVSFSRNWQAMLYCCHSDLPSREHAQVSPVTTGTGVFVWVPLCPFSGILPVPLRKSLGLSQPCH